MTEENAVVVNEDVVAKEDLKALVDLKSSAVLAASQAKTAELEYRNAMLQVFLKHKMSGEDSINEQTGEIKRAE